jgi:hypothetical protein
MSRSLLTLTPEAARRFGEWLRRCGGKGVAVCVYCTYRDEAEQARLYAIGRDAAGKRIPGKAVVTYARPGQSNHQKRIAVDAAPFVENDLTWPRKLDWTPFPDRERKALFQTTGSVVHLDRIWGVMVREAESCGISWAGRWTRFREYCHFEFLEDT